MINLIKREKARRTARIARSVKRRKFANYWDKNMMMAVMFLVVYVMLFITILNY